MREICLTKHEWKTWRTKYRTRWGMMGRINCSDRPIVPRVSEAGPLGIWSGSLLHVRLTRILLRARANRILLRARANRILLRARANLHCLTSIFEQGDIWFIFNFTLSFHLYSSMYYLLYWSCYFSLSRIICKTDPDVMCHS